MGILGFGKKKPKKENEYGFESTLTKAQKKKAHIRVHVSGEDASLKRSVKTSAKDIKPIQYYETLRIEVKPLEDIMVNFAVALKEQKSVEDRIEILKALIESFYDLKSKCVSLGEDYKKYFSDMWERQHNSKCEDFCYVDRYEKELGQHRTNSV